MSRKSLAPQQQKAKSVILLDDAFCVVWMYGNFILKKRFSSLN